MEKSYVDHLEFLIEQIEASFLLTNRLHNYKTDTMSRYQIKKY